MNSDEDALNIDKDPKEIINGNEVEVVDYGSKININMAIIEKL